MMLLKSIKKGTNRVNEERVDIRVKMFEMKEYEAINEMFNSFTIILNEISSLENIIKLMRELEIFYEIFERFGDQPSLMQQPA